MNTYEESTLFSGRRGATFTAVILLHFVFGFALYSELGGRIMQSLHVPPLDLLRFEPPKASVKPLPATPQLDQPKIDVPPAEFPPLSPPSDPVVTVETAPRDPPITVTHTLPQPDFARVPVRMDPRHPLRIGADYYPDASRRANEMGRCVVRVTVAADGRIIAAIIQTRTGFERLDQACLNGVKGQRMLPATEDGRAVESTISIPIVWNLSE